MTSQSAGYYSSEEKDIIREDFDFPLLERLYRQKNQRLSYFGLPGADALDIKSWRNMIGEIGAVDKHQQNLEKLETQLDLYFSDIRYNTHYGEVDQIIIKNRGKKRELHGQMIDRTVGNYYEQSVAKRVWRFDVVYLDYFGPFLPLHGRRGPKRARDRTAALRKLFDTDRVDAWQPWILLITVDTRLYPSKTRAILAEYLKHEGLDASSDTRCALDYLRLSSPDDEANATKLIHGATSLLISNAASNANLDAKARGTIMYEGANGRQMIHMAFEFTPRNEIFGTLSGRLNLLTAPFLKPVKTQETPRLALLPNQPPGLTREVAAGCLEFLDPDVKRAMLDQWS